MSVKELYKLTKEELVVRCRKLQSENEKLKDELDSLSDRYTELEYQVTTEVHTLDDFGVSI